MSGSHYPSGLVEQLKQSVSGSVITPRDSDYDKQRKPWLQVVDQHPSVIVNALTTEDIAATVRIAGEFHLPLGVQHTGHGIAVACNQGVLLRLASMNEIAIDPQTGTATVGPGVCSGELLAAAEPYGLAYPTGQVSRVGVIGYTLGGGYGWLGRELGVACAHMVSATVVLAGGEVVTASARENPDFVLGDSRWWRKLWRHCQYDLTVATHFERFRWRRLLPRGGRKGSSALLQAVDSATYECNQHIRKN